MTFRIGTELEIEGGKHIVKNIEVSVFEGKYETNSNDMF